jgi:hypothetical protein
LPTYNSNVIELHCWRIPGLNEHFILLNDDFLFTNPVWPSDFFTADGEKVVDMTSQFLLMPHKQQLVVMKFQLDLILTRIIALNREWENQSLVQIYKQELFSCASLSGCNRYRK